MQAQEAESVAAAHCLVRAQSEARLRAPLQLWRQLAQHARNVHALHDNRQGCLRGPEHDEHIAAESLGDCSTQKQGVWLALSKLKNPADLWLGGDAGKVQQECARKLCP